MSKLAIVGNTSVGDELSARLLIRMSIHWFEPEVVISGGAPGIDTIAAEEAEMDKIPVLELRPTVQRWTLPGGFRDRNIRIAEECTHLVRIANRFTRTYGSGWTADYAEKLGRKVFRYYLEAPK